LVASRMPTSSAMPRSSETSFIVKSSMVYIQC
jgi:hypothetical protein